MSGWSPKELISKEAPKLLEVSQTGAALCSDTSIFAGGAQRALVVAIFSSGIAGTSTVQLQHSMGNNVYDNIAGKTVVLANGWVYVKFNNALAGDAALMPLFDTLRLVYTSNGSAAGSVLNVKILQES